MALARALVREPTCSCSTSPSPTSTPSCARRPDELRVPRPRRHDHHLRHPRPGRGDGHGRPHRGACRRRRSARSALRRRSTRIRPTRSSPPSWVTADEPGHARRRDRRLPPREGPARASVLGGRRRRHRAFAVDRIEYLSGARHRHGVHGTRRPHGHRAAGDSTHGGRRGETSFVLLAVDLRFFDPATERARDPVRLGRDSHPSRPRDLADRGACSPA